MDFIPQPDHLIKNLKNNIWALFVVSFFVSILSAQSRFIKFEHISVNEGLCQSSGRVLFQDSKGFIWCGTQDGLNKFDGYQFKTYRYNPKDENSISESFILAAFEDTNDIIWIGTSGGGLNKFDVKSKKFIRFKRGKKIKNSISNNFVNKIYKDTKKKLWFATVDGLNKLNNNNSFIHYKYHSENQSRIKKYNIHDFIESNYGDLGIFWIGTKFGGLNKFDPEKGKFIGKNLLPNASNKLTTTIQIIHECTSGELWCGTNGGLFKFNPKTEKYAQHYIIIPPCG